ncbi:adenosylcobinamide-GDP ribazoletransferase [Salipiger sp.]|uniref:adenosylcobinamide-GDP ribazoletransferase n=1 Tax=Salipiger sp. TaxID=2078585 RepID=UPI003A96E1C6
MSGAGARLREVRLALMLLTRLPVGRMAGEAPPLVAARWAFPLAGVPVGLIGWAAHAGAVGVGASPAMAALLALAALVLVTGAMHVDGLADFADGIGGGRDRAHCLDIMRDSRIGSYGVIALILSVGLWASALAALAGQAGAGWFVALAVLSRAMMAALQEGMKPARTDGLGHLSRGRSLAARVMIAACALIVVLWGGAAGAGILLSMVLTAGYVAFLAQKRLGGVTGDVLGTAQILSEIAGWVALACLSAA